MSCTADNLYFLVSAAIFGRQVKRPRLGKCTREPPKGVSHLGKCAHDTPQGVSGTHVWAKARMKRPRVFLAHNIRPRVFILDLGVKHTPKPQVGTSRKLPSLWLCCRSRCQEMLPKTCFSSRLAAVAHFETRRSRWTAFFQTKTKLTQGGLVKLGVTAQISARVGASLLEMKPFCPMPRGFLSPVIISRVCLTATSLRSRPWRLPSCRLFPRAACFVCLLSLLRTARQPCTMSGQPPFVHRGCFLVNVVV